MVIEHMNTSSNIIISSQSSHSIASKLESSYIYIKMLANGNEVTYKDPLQQLIEL